jgi:threonine synthase
MEYTFKTEDIVEAMDIINASNYSQALFEIQNNLWRKWKHDESTLNVDTLKESINEIFEQHNITIQ